MSVHNLPIIIVFCYRSISACFRKKFCMTFKTQIVAFCYSNATISASAKMTVQNAACVEKDSHFIQIIIPVSSWRKLALSQKIRC